MTEEQAQQIRDRLDFIGGQLHALAALTNIQIRATMGIAPEGWQEEVARYQPREGFEGEYKVGYQVSMNRGID